MHLCASWWAHATAAAEVVMLWQACNRRWTGDPHILILDAPSEDNDSAAEWHPVPERCSAVALEGLLADRVLGERYGDLHWDGSSGRRAAIAVHKP